MKLAPLPRLLSLLVKGCSLGKGGRVELEDGAKLRAFQIDFLDAGKVRLHEVDASEMASFQAGLRAFS